MAMTAENFGVTCIRSLVENSAEKFRCLDCPEHHCPINPLYEDYMAHLDEQYQASVMREMAGKGYY